MKDRGDGISSSQASATGLLQLAFKSVAVVAAMTITTAITVKMGSVPRLTRRERARHVGTLPPALNFPVSNTK